jgi:hypothetical protein
MIATFFITLLAAMSGNIWVAAIVAMGVGIAKELYDLWSGGVFSYGDLAADAIGVLCAILFIGFIWRKNNG